MKIVYQGLGKARSRNGSNHKYRIAKTITYNCWLKENSVILKEHMVFWAVYENW